MQAVILAAGRGERMRPLTLNTPKPLLKVAGKPLLNYLFDALPSEITSVVLVVKYLREKIERHCGTVFYRRQIMYVEGSDAGTAMSFLAAVPYIADERFLFLYGDELPSPDDVRACLKHPLSILCLRMENPHQHSVALLRADGTIAEIQEKPDQPTSHLVANGVMVLNQSIFSIPPILGADGEYRFTDMLNEFVQANRVMAVHSSTDIGGISTPADITRVESMLRNRGMCHIT